jgi:hypothetical protein
MRFMGVLLIGVALGMSAGACAIAKARPATAVPLEIPEPPPRAAIDPVQLPEPPPPEQRSIPRPPPPAADTTAGRQGRPPSTASTPAPTPAPASVPPAGAAPPVASAPAPATPELRPTGTSSPAISLNAVRQMMARTAKKLEALDRRKLSAGKQADYDAARRFLSQAQEAVKANNVMLAQYSAEKAETLADGLR